MSYLNVEYMNKSFVDAKSEDRRIVTAVRDLSIDVERGQILALLGASGSGKTTLLRCVAGLETPDSGAVRVSGETIYDSERHVDVPAHRRNMGMVFQSYALWPHMTVAQNVAYPLAQNKVPKRDHRQRVTEYLELVDCAPLSGRYPHELSGGQQQRIALARALVAKPRIVLFDEPLSNLDANLREQLRYQIREVQRREGFTGLYVTHDHSEALFIADRIAIIDHGLLLQVGTPNDLYDMPASAAVAEFLGSTNSVHGRVEAAGGGLLFKSAVGHVALGQVRVADGARDEAAVLKCHPSWVELVPHSGGEGFAGRVVDSVRAAADTVEYLVELAPDTVWRCRGPVRARGLSTGDVVLVRPALEHAYVFEAG